MTSQLPPFPVTTEDIVEQMASQAPPKRPRRCSSPISSEGTPPPAKSGSSMFLSPSSLSPSRSGSRRTSLMGLDADSRRSSVAKVASDLKKGVRNVTNSTKKATNKVKDKTADVGAHVMGATVGASKWVATHTSKRAKAAMDQAKSGLSIGEKFTLFASEKISVLSRRGFTHVFMLLVLIAYTAMGALLFIACEGPHEEKEKLAITEERLLLTEALWNKTSNDFPSFTKEVKVLLEPYEDELYRAFSVGVSFNTEERVWTFWKAMFFCATITTTIGYGHITPKTTAGRALTIVYALIGIPIFLIIMADFGKLFTRLLKHLFIFLRRVYRSGTCTRARNNPTVKGISKKATGGIGNVRDKVLQKKKHDPDPELGDKQISKDKTDENGSVTGEPEQPPFEDPSAVQETDYFADDNLNLPISIALFILILYMIVGCFIYISWEPWTFFEAFYFIFVSMTTIGFGDFVPEHPAYMMTTALYLVFGLALTAMCINIIQEKLTHTFREASTKLKESFNRLMEAAAAANTDDIDGPLVIGPPIIVPPQEDGTQLSGLSNPHSSTSHDQ